MKKITVLLLGILMLFAVAADTFAETTVGGTIDVRGRWRENDNDLNKDEYGSTAFWEEKVNLWVDAKIAEGLKGYVELQSDGSDGFTAWGTSRPTSTAAPNSFLNENRSYGAMEIRYAYIDFMIPKTPVGIKIGHFPGCPRTQHLGRYILLGLGWPFDLFFTNKGINDWSWYIKGL